MLFLLLTWLIVGSLWWIIGQGLFAGSGIQSRPQDHPLDNIPLQLLLGMSLTGLVWYFVALWTPLTPGIAIITIALLLFMSYCLHSWSMTFPYKFEGWMGGFVVLAVIIAWFMAQPITVYDTGLYHYPAIKWLADYGAVSGLALFNFLLAYPSSWLALSAPFENLFPSQAGTIISGLTLLVTVAKLIPSLIRIQCNQSSFLDWFWILANAICLGLLFSFGLLVSPSPDTGVICLGLWLLFTWIKSISEPLTRQDFVPLGLAIAAFSYKMSALPLLVGVILWLLVRYRYHWRIILVVFASTGIALSPVFLFGLQTSGCPLFPTSLFCLEQLPWSIGAQQAQALSRIIQEGARWQFVMEPPLQYTWLDWFVPWIFKQQRATFLLLCNLALFVFVLGRAMWQSLRCFLSSGRINISTVVSPYWSLWILVVLGTAIVLFGSPNVRFGVVYWSIMPSLWGAKLCMARSPLRWLNFWLVGLSVNLWIKPSLTLGLLLLVLVILSLLLQWRGSQLSPLAFVIGVFVLAISVTTKTSLEQFRYQFNWVWPAPIQPKNEVALVQQQLNDVVYVTPDPTFRWQRWPDRLAREDRCWDAAPPCAPDITVPELQLRQPHRGVQGGFVRTTGD